MTRFARLLRELTAQSATPRSWVYVAYDQLNGGIGPLATADPAEFGLVLVESRAKAARRPYHQQKLAFVLANQRHFALEQARRGFAVRYLAGAAGYGEQLRPFAREHGPLTAMWPAERELRDELQPLVEQGLLEYVEHGGWLTTYEDFAAGGEPPWRMDVFYRQVRRRTGLLMVDGKPEGGRFSFDGENRKSWPGDPPAPDPPIFEPDGITREVAELVEREFADHPGRVDTSSLPATRRDAAHLWDWARTSCLPRFGPYEDAMSARSSGLFHTRISPLLNVHRLLPRDVVTDVAASDAPLPSREGFVRQVLGWREFVRHVHEATDGFRAVQGVGSPPSALGAETPLPAAWWGTESGLACLDSVVADVWREAWTHHIPRLMVLSNIATLLDVSPRELTDWFWVAYVDAYDWVVEPNVLGMGTFAVGELMTTKPYVSGAGYIHRMSDYCKSCAFDPKRDCPLTRMYWAFLARHGERLAETQRMGLPLRNLARRAPAERRRDAETFARVSAALARGERLTPEPAPA